MTQEMIDVLRDLFDYAEDCALERDERPSCIEKANEVIKALEAKIS